MPLTLHEAFVPGVMQILSGMHTVIDNAEAHCTAHGMDPGELYEAKLAETMWPLPYHVRACWVHSAYAIELYKTGEFSPDFTQLPGDWNAMRTMIDDTLAQLAQVDPDALDATAGDVIGFVLGGKRLLEMPAQKFLLNFNQPNFYFHATTFYDILRMKGVALSKRDFTGANARPMGI